MPSLQPNRRRHEAGRWHSALHYCREAMNTAAGNRFAVEVERSLLGERYTPEVFEGLVESEETLALQRGLERWEP